MVSDYHKVAWEVSWIQPARGRQKHEHLDAESAIDPDRKRGFERCQALVAVKPSILHQ